MVFCPCVVDWLSGLGCGSSAHSTSHPADPPGAWLLASIVEPCSQSATPSQLAFEPISILKRTTLLHQKQHCRIITDDDVGKKCIFLKQMECYFEVLKIMIRLQRVF